MSDDLNARLLADADRNRARAAELRALGEIKVPEVSGLELGAAAWTVAKAGVYLVAIAGAGFLRGMAGAGIEEAAASRGAQVGGWIKGLIGGGGGK